MLDFIRNRRKPILGLIAGAIVYAATAVGLDVDKDVATMLAGVIFAAVVERSRPVFGEPVESPIVRGHRR